MSVKWRTVWRGLLHLWIAVGAVMSIVTLTSNPTASFREWVGMIGASVLLVWSYRDEDKARIAELERRADTDGELRTALVSRVADLMDSATRLDPIYREWEMRRKRTEATLRDARRGVHG